MSRLWEVKALSELKIPNSRYRGFGVLRTINLLKCLVEKELCFSELFEKCDINYKKAYLGYLHFIVEMGFVRKERRKFKERSFNVFYCLTEKGKIFLDLFEVES